MPFADTSTLTAARSYIAALADGAHTIDGSVEYERALLHLDALYGGDVPALAEIAADGPQDIYDLAEDSLANLVGHGIDALQLELLLSLLEDARAADQP